MDRLKGQVAIVTGSSKGIGKAIALELAREGAALTVNYNSDAAGAAAVVDEIKGFGGKAIAVGANVSTYEGGKTLAAATVEAFGRIDILVNNAGITRDKSFKNMSEQMWHEVVNANLDSLFNVTHNVLPTMLAQKSGHIICISSMIGQTGAFGQVNYGATKAGIVGFTRSLALETAKNGINVNTICPGYTETEMSAAIPPDRMEAIKARIPMGRFATGKEIARAVIFLATEADYITGQQININGGLYMG
jgi:acetoacetyl-CoA reductase